MLLAGLLIVVEFQVRQVNRHQFHAAPGYPSKAKTAVGGRVDVHLQRCVDSLGVNLTRHRSVALVRLGTHQGRLAAAARARSSSSRLGRHGRTGCSVVVVVVLVGIGRLGIKQVGAKVVHLFLLLLFG